MKYTYKINSGLVAFSEFEIDADDYILKDGYFNFFDESDGQEKVASLMAEHVAIIERTQK